jgi:hypothetical protein
MRAGAVECDLNRPLPPPSSLSWINKIDSFQFSKHITSALCGKRKCKEKNSEEKALSINRSSEV